MGEHPHLPYRLVALQALAGLHRRLQHLHVGGPALAEGIEGSALDEAFDHPAVDDPEVDPAAEVGQARERPPLGPRRQDGVHGSPADVLDRGQAEPNHVAHDGEVLVALVDVGRGDGDAHLAALVHVDHDLVGVFGLAGQQGRHELHRIVGLQIRRLVGDEAVGRAV